MRSRDETLHSQRQILLLSGCLEWKPLCSSGMVWRFLLCVNGGKHSSCLRGLCDFIKVNTWTWCKWWHFISDAVCVSRAKHGGVCRGKTNMIKERSVFWKQFERERTCFQQLYLQSKVRKWLFIAVTEFNLVLNSPVFQRNTLDHTEASQWPRQSCLLAELWRFSHGMGPKVLSLYNHCMVVNKYL